MLGIRSRAERIVTAVILGFLAALPAGAADGGGIAWSVTPYIWATDTSVDLTVDDAPVGSGNISFSDLLDATDTSFQIVVEGGAKEGKWSAFLDLTYLDTSDDWTRNIEGTDLRIDSDSEQWFIDAAVAYWPRGEAGGLNFYGGLRYTDLEDEYKFTDVGLGQPVGVLVSDRDFTVALLGVRYRFDMVRHWSVFTRADYASGDSDGIVLLEAVIRYAVGRTRQHGIMFGYRYKEAEFEEDGVEEDYEYKGPIAGFNFRF